MTNAEAIEILGPDPLIDEYTLQKLGWDKATKRLQAMHLAIAALREKAEKGRRYVVKVTIDGSEVYVACGGLRVSEYLHNNEAGNKTAQAIADIYEGMEG